MHPRGKFSCMLSGLQSSFDTKKKQKILIKNLVENGARGISFDGFLSCSLCAIGINVYQSMKHNRSIDEAIAMPHRDQFLTTSIHNLYHEIVPFLFAEVKFDFLSDSRIKAYRIEVK